MNSQETDKTADKEQIIQLPKICDARGNLSFIEGLRHIPFAIRRAYWIYDVPGGEVRGGHAFHEQEEFIVALSGCFDVVLHDGMEERRYQLNRSYMGVYVPRMMWRRMENFSTNSLCLVLSSTRYDEADYIYDFERFVFLLRREKNPALPEKKNAEVFPPLESFHASRADSCRLFPLPKVHNPAGNLTALNNGIELPFDIRRVYYLYDIPCGEQRGGHAHRTLMQVLVAASGSFSVTLDDGCGGVRTVFLNSPFQALCIVPGIWRTLDNFSSGAVCLVLASHEYDEEDYIREYDDFIMYKKKHD